MKKISSLKSNFRFRAVYDGGRSAAGKYFVLFVLENSLKLNRLGITVTKKIGIAVVRNRARRIIKESFRLNEPVFVPGLDIVILARPAIVGANIHSVMPELLRLAKKLRVTQ